MRAHAIAFDAPRTPFSLAQKSILVAVDGSAASENAVLVAVQIGREYASKILLTTVVDLSSLCCQGKLR